MAIYQQYISECLGAYLSQNAGELLDIVTLCKLLPLLVCQACFHNSIATYLLAKSIQGKMELEPFC